MRLLVQEARQTLSTDDREWLERLALRERAERDRWATAAEAGAARAAAVAAGERALATEAAAAASALQAQIEAAQAEAWVARARVDAALGEVRRVVAEAALLAREDAEARLREGACVRACTPVTYRRVCGVWSCVLLLTCNRACMRARGLGSRGDAWARRGEASEQLTSRQLFARFFFAFLVHRP
jgi:hypothetical protein